MSIKPEVRDRLADDVFLLDDEELLYRVPSTGIDWAMLEAIDFHRAKVIGSHREYLRDRSIPPSPGAELSYSCPAHRRFEIYAQWNPGAGAVKFGRTELTYGELDTQADGLAVRLQQIGILPGELCALYMEPSLAMVRSILAVLKAGAAFLLLDPTLPRERIAAILSISHPRAIIAQESFSPKLDATEVQIILCGEDAVDLPYSWPQESPARGMAPFYAISRISETGSLNIVVRTHSTVIDWLDSMQEINPIGQGDSVLENAAPALDIWELLWPLSHGARVVIPSARDAMNPERVRQLIIQEHITVMHATPPLLQPLLTGARQNELRSLRALLWAIERPAISSQGTRCN